MRYYLNNYTQERFVSLLFSFFDSFEGESYTHYQMKKQSPDQYIAQKRLFNGINLLHNSFDYDIVIHIQRNNTGLDVEFSFVHGGFLKTVYAIFSVIIFLFTLLLIRLFYYNTLNIIQFMYGCCLIIFVVLFIQYMNKKSRNKLIKSIDTFMQQLDE